MCVGSTFNCIGGLVIAGTCMSVLVLYALGVLVWHWGRVWRVRRTCTRHTGVEGPLLPARVTLVRTSAPGGVVATCTLDSTIGFRACDDDTNKAFTVTKTWTPAPGVLGVLKDYGDDRVPTEILLWRAPHSRVVGVWLRTSVLRNVLEHGYCVLTL
jgi:hypothetical protein